MFKSLGEIVLQTKTTQTNRYFKGRTIHIVTQFPVMHHDQYERQKEYINTLKLNLNHPLVERIHLLLENDHDDEYISNLTTTNNINKIRYHPLNRRMRYGDAFRYTSQFLLNKTAIIMNADCYLGHGFQKLNEKSLRRGTIYALTRHERKKYCKENDLCSAQARYIGSHDAFVMNLVRPLSKKVLNTLMVRQNIVGVEKFVIYTLREHGKYKIKNPCHILVIYHNHCSGFRKLPARLINGKRFNVEYLKNVTHWKTVAPFSGL